MRSEAAFPRYSLPVARYHLPVDTPKTYRYTKSHRLAGRGVFKGVMDRRVKDNRGPLTIFAAPNELGHPRLGISIGRPVGTAVVRNRIKRLLREAFRHLQHDFPRGYDLVVLVRRHQPLLLADYQRALSGAMVKLHKRWSERP
jgi:ribonuclease P protein component